MHQTSLKERARALLPTAHVALLHQISRVPIPGPAEPDDLPIVTDELSERPVSDDDVFRRRPGSPKLEAEKLVESGELLQFTVADLPRSFPPVNPLFYCHLSRHRLGFDNKLIPCEIARKDWPTVERKIYCAPASRGLARDLIGSHVQFGAHGKMYSPLMVALAISDFFSLNWRCIGGFSFAVPADRKYVSGSPHLLFVRRGPLPLSEWPLRPESRWHGVVGGSLLSSAKWAVSATLTLLGDEEARSVHQFIAKNRYSSRQQQDGALAELARRYPFIRERADSCHIFLTHCEEKN